MLTTLWAEADPFAPWLQLVMQGGALVVLLLLAYQMPRALGALKAWRHETEVAHREEREQMRRDAREEREQVRAAAREEREQAAALAAKAQAAIVSHCDERDKRAEAVLGSMQKEIEYLHEAVEALGRPRRKQPPQGGQQT